MIGCDWKVWMTTKLDVFVRAFYRKCCMAQDSMVFGRHFTNVAARVTELYVEYSTFVLAKNIVRASVLEDVI